jgi:protein SCO1/2
MRRPLHIGLFAVAAIAAYLSHRHGEGATSALPDFGKLPAFQLSDERGAPYSRDALLGKITVVDFIFTSCSTICPTLSTKMAELQRELVARHQDDRVRLLSISVDPERDTPERLQALAARHGADAKLWHFVRGSDAALQAVVVDGMKQVLEHDGSDASSILHSMRFVLIDDQARIRGFYDATDPAAMTQLRDHAAALAAATGR